MPSGLTSKIYSGEDLTLRGFALNCVRQLGIQYIINKLKAQKGEEV